MREGEKVKFPGMNRMWRMLNRNELEILDNHACRVLSEMGVHIDDKDCIEYFKDTPIEVDEKELIAKFPEYWIKEMLNKAPGSFILAGRDPNWDCHFTSLQTDFFCFPTSGSTKIYEWDEKTSQWNSRIPGEADVIRGFRIVDAIDTYEGFFGTMVEDVEKTNEGLPAELHTAYNKMKWSVKHGGPVAITEGGVRSWDYLGVLAAEVQGGFDELRKRPLLAGLPTCIGPLTSTRQNFWAMVGSAKYGMPTFPYWGGTSPFTAPATVLAQTVMALACCHYGIAVQQYLAPGTPSIPWPMCTPTDPATGQLAVTPAPYMVAGAGNQVYQDLYKIPVSQCSYCLTSPLDEAGVAWTISALIQTIQGANIVQWGTTPQAFIYETLPMGESIMNFTKSLLFEFKEDLLMFDKEHLAMDVIMETGPEKLYTTHPHTLKWIDPKQGLFWHSNDWIHQHADQWLAQGAKTWVEVCRERLKELEKHEPTPLPKDIDERQKKILQQADEELALF